MLKTVVLLNIFEGKMIIFFKNYFISFEREIFCNIIQIFAFNQFKGIVHFEIIFGMFLAYLKCIRDVGVFVCALVSILVFLGVSHIM